MSFRNHLTTLVNAVEGSMAATVMGLDGIAIDVCSVPGSPPDLETAFVEGSGLMTSARRIADSLDSGGVSELALATGVTVEYVDERFTSRMAESTLLESGMKRRDRKENVDKVAAAIFLQDYLDRLTDR